MKGDAAPDRAGSPAIVDDDRQNQTPKPDNRQEQRQAEDETQRALVRALEAATATGDFDAVRVIVDELRARRLERSGVVDLAARARKGGAR